MHTDYGEGPGPRTCSAPSWSLRRRGVTEAASRLYLTQPAVSAALRRLTNSVRCAGAGALGAWGHAHGSRATLAQRGAAAPRRAGARRARAGRVRSHDQRTHRAARPVRRRGVVAVAAAGSSAVRVGAEAAARRDAGPVSHRGCRAAARQRNHGAVAETPHAAQAAEIVVKRTVFPQSRSMTCPTSAMLPAARAGKARPELFAMLSGKAGMQARKGDACLASVERLETTPAGSGWSTDVPSDDTPASSKSLRVSSGGH